MFNYGQISREFSIILTVFVVLTVVSTRGSKQEEYVSDAIRTLKEDDFSEFVNGTEVTALFFTSHDLSEFKEFLEYYENAGETLMKYGIKVGKVICEDLSPIQFCEAIDKENGVLYAFRNGTMKLKLPPVQYLSYSAILSTILHLKLVRDVPVIQTLEERIKLEEESVAERDIIFMYITHMFTSSHAFILQMSQEYKSLKFAITSNEKATENLKKGKLASLIEQTNDEDEETEPKTWLIRCKKAETKCKSVAYDNKLNYETFKWFLASLERSSTYTEAKWPDNFEDLLLSRQEKPIDETDNQVFLVYTDDTREEVLKTAELVGEDYIGHLDVMTINMDKTPEEAFNLLGVNRSSLSPPSIIFMRSNEDPAIANKYDNPFDFISQRYEEGYSAKFHELEYREFYSEGICNSELILEGPLQQDDMIAQRVMDSGEPDLTHIATLNDENIEKNLKSKEISLVLYHVKWDHLSKATIHILSNVAKHLFDQDLFNKPILMIDCFDWNDICDKQGVRTYPTIKFFGKEFEPKTYNGLIDVAEIITSFHLQSKRVPLEIKSRKDAEAFLKGTPADSAISSFFLGVFPDKRSEEYQHFVKACQELRGEVLGAVCTDNVAEELSKKYQHKTPFIIVSRPADAYKSTAILTAGNSIEENKKILLTNKKFTLDELGGHNFHNYNLQDIPTVILFLSAKSDNSGIKSTVGKVASFMNTFNFAWMNRSSSIAQTTIESYGLQNILNNFVAVLNRNQNSLYVFDGPIKENTLQAWLTGLPSSSKLTKNLFKKEWKPLVKPFDFLKMVEKEESLDNAKTNSLKSGQKKDEAVSITANPITLPTVVSADSSELHRHSEL